MRDMRDLIRSLADEGMTVLLSSHLLGEVEELCNRVAIVRKGGLAYQGSLAELRAQAGDGYLLRTTDDERAPRSPRRSRGSSEVAARRSRAGSRFRAPDEDAGRRAVAGADRVAGALLRADPEPGDARGPLLRADRGRRRRRRRTARAGAWRSGRHEARHPHRLPLGARKLRFQKRTYLGLGAAALVPIIFVVAVATQKGGPEDVAFGRYIHDTGLAIPFVLLLFGSIWMFPLITALVAGDIVAAEDHNGTLKTILTRSVERSQVFAAQGARHRDVRHRGDRADRHGRGRRGLDRLRASTRSRRCRGRRSSPAAASCCSARSLLVYLMPILAIAAIGLLSRPCSATAPRPSSGR